MHRQSTEFLWLNFVVIDLWRSKRCATKPTRLHCEKQLLLWSSADCCRRIFAKDICNKTRQNIMQCFRFEDKNEYVRWFNQIYFFLRTSGNERFNGIRSLANRLKRFIWNSCCILSISLGGITTGFPFSPSPSTGAKLFSLITSVCQQSQDFYIFKLLQTIHKSSRNK